MLAVGWNGWLAPTWAVYVI